jgi:monoamine oxidase
MTQQEECDAIIIGAGAAGIGAARKLLGLDSNSSQKALSTNKDNLIHLKKVIILEARDRIGGRVWTSDELQCGLKLDHGGKWIHGSTSPSNVMTKLARQHNILTTRETKKNGSITRIVLPKSSSSSGGQIMQSFPSNKQAQMAADLLFEQICNAYGAESLLAPYKNDPDLTYMDCLTSIAKKDMPNGTFTEWVETRAKDALATTGCNEVHNQQIQETIALLRLQICRYFEGYEGGTLENSSLRYTFGGSCLEGENANVDGGYGKILSTLATPLDIRFGHCVDRIDRDSCTVQCIVAGGSKTFVAKQGIIVTVPLGVLQDSRLVFDPPLPVSIRQSIDSLKLGLMNKIEMLFPIQWWPDDIQTLSIASVNAPSQNSTPLGDIPFCHWIVESDSPAVLVCYTSGEFAERIEGMSNEDIQRDAIHALRLAFEGDNKCSSTGNNDILSVPDPLRTHVTRWRSDRYSRGSWTFFGAGSRGVKDLSTFQRWNLDSRNKGGNLFFAGEHACDGSVAGLDVATVHGSYLSGQLAASDLMGTTASEEEHPTNLKYARPTNYTMYRHVEERDIPPQEGYVPGRKVQVTSDPNDIAAEFSCDPEEAGWIESVQDEYLGQSGEIIESCSNGWLLVQFPRNRLLEARYFTPYCLLLGHETD